ncbi:MAG TPA: hypothetical protein VMT69_08430 [Kineosporiaceae bacterium]|nr:hypothetical protein [Kineosporiaceae bacterium]
MADTHDGCGLVPAPVDLHLAGTHPALPETLGRHAAQEPAGFLPPVPGEARRDPGQAR